MYQGDPDWLYELGPAEKRRSVWWYLRQRKEAEAGLWSAAGLQAVDLVHLGAKLGGKVKKSGKADLMDGLLGQLLDEG